MGSTSGASVYACAVAAVYDLIGEGPGRSARRCWPRRPGCTGPRWRRRGGAWPSPPSTAARRTSAATTPTHSRSRRVSSPAWADGCTARIRAALRQPPRDGYLAYCCDIRGPRQWPVRCGCGHEAAVRLRPSQPDAGGARGEQAPEEREGRRGVAAAGEPVLVCGPGRGDQAQVPAHRGRARCACPGGGLDAVRLDRDGGGRRAGSTRCGAGTRTGTGASPAARRVRTASPRFGAGTRPTASCATATGTAWCASEGADRSALQVTGKRRRILMALKLKVPWSTELEPLEVDLSRVCEENFDTVMREIRKYGPPHVRTNEGDVIVENFFGVNNRVPDVSRYHIDNDGQPVRHFDVPESRLQIQLGSIVLLLESPSVDEYQFGSISFPVVPANGESGEKIDRCLGTVLSDIQKEFNQAGLNEEQLIRYGHIKAKLIVPYCHVIISNPIQFQTNLRSIHGQSTWDSPWNTLRNNVWKALWKEGPEEDRLGYIQLCFRERLNTYRPNLIVNACTGDLKNPVKDFVRRELPKVPLYQAHHPADTSWNDCDDNCDGIGLERIYPDDAIADDQQ